jgi:hypothetical protein
MRSEAQMGYCTLDLIVDGHRCIGEEAWSEALTVGSRIVVVAVHDSCRREE